MNKYIFIAVNFNGSSFTIPYIDSINKIIRKETDQIKIIIVDNNSNKVDYQILEKYCKTMIDVRLIRLNENLGYFKGLNKAIVTFNKDASVLVIIGNNDLTFDSNFIVNLKKIKYNPNVYVIAPNIITKGGRQQNPHVIDRVTSFEKFKTKVYFSNYYVGKIFKFANQIIKKSLKKGPILKNNARQMKIKRGIGACYILTYNFFRKFEVLDDRVFMWGEEALLSHQVESEGGITIYDPSIIVDHHESASVNNIHSKQKYYMVKKSYKIYKKYL